MMDCADSSVRLTMRSSPDSRCACGRHGAVQDRLGVAGWLSGALEHELAGGQEGLAVERGGHGVLVGVCGVLFVHDGGHAPQGRFHFLRGHDAVQQPVGDVL